MQKKRQLKTCIVAIALMCLLTISMTFQTICVKTISDNYINSLIVNQIIDLIIDEEKKEAIIFASSEIVFQKSNEHMVHSNKFAKRKPLEN